MATSYGGAAPRTVDAQVGGAAEFLYLGGAARQLEREAVPAVQGECRGRRRPVDHRARRHRHRRLGGAAWAGRRTFGGAWTGFDRRGRCCRRPRSAGWQCAECAGRARPVTCSPLRRVVRYRRRGCPRPVRSPPNARRPRKRSPEGGAGSSRKPSSVPLRRAGWSSVWDGRRRPPRAAYPRLTDGPVREPPALSVWVTPRRLFGLAPTGGCRATDRYRRCGGLLPHRFTLTTLVAVCFLWPCPSPCGAQALPGSLPGGARTFLERPKAPATTALNPGRI